VLGYVMVGASGYAAYPNDVASNVLNSFDDSDPMLQVQSWE
jgi:amino acid permease